MTTPDPTPLQKQIFDIELGGGVNERDRPETAPPNKTLSRVENLFQDQGGSYVKRYGTPLLGGVSTDDTGTALTSPTKLLRLKGGLGMIGNSGKYYQYMEANSRFTKKDEVPDWNIVLADQVVSSGPQGVPKIHGVASSTKYHAVLYEASPGVTVDVGWRVALYDRNAQAVVLSIDVGTALNLAITVGKVVFVTDRYIHVYGSSATTTKVVVYDTTLNPITTVAAALSHGTGTIVDYDVTTDRSFVLTNNAGTTTLRGTDNAGAAVTSSNTTTSPALALSASGTNLWYITATQKGSRSTTNLTSVTNAEAVHGFTSPLYFVANGSTLTIVGQSALTFGASTLNTVSAAGGIKIYGWAIASAPFLDSASGNTYIHLTKVSGLTVVGHAVARIQQAGALVTGINIIDTNGFNSLKTAASLEPHLGVANSDVLKYFPVGVEYCPAVPIQTVARGYAYCVFSMKPFFHANVVTQVFGGQNYISGGCHCVLGSNKVQESGYVDMPVLNTVQSATAGPTGSFKHIAVYRFVDESGAVTWSRTSVLASTTTTAKGIDVTISPPCVTNRDVIIVGANPQPFLQSVELYRTKTGATTYYLCGSSQIGTPVTGLLTQKISLSAAGLFTVTDVLTDANLALQPTLFRQPGTANAAVDRYPPPCGNILCQHKDRLFTTDPYGVRVYYSSFFVDGETAWYNPVFSFFVHGGSGPITGMVSMDGRLFVFKRDGVFVIDGDGPAEGGVAGNEFSPPQRLATEYGCIDQRSLVVTTDGIVYRSARGIEILTRSLQVKWLGERVQNTVNANAKVTGAVLDSYGRVHIGLAVSDTGTATQAATLGCELVFDAPADCWTVSYHTDNGGTANRCFQDMCQADLYGIGETVCYADPTGAVCYTDATSGLDRGSRYVGWTLETVWIKTGQQARARFSKALLLAKKKAGANHKITISVAYNYVDSYTQVGTFEPGVINAAAIEELQQNIAKPEAVSIRLLIQEGIPTDTGTYPVGTGRGCDILGVSVEIAAKHGAPTLASGQKV